MELTPRLKTIVSFVTSGNRVIDVGCDHAYVPIFLIQNRIAKEALACDVRRGPLERADANIRKYGLEDRIRTRLCDGLQGVEPGEGDTLIIAGMGGTLMKRILEDRMNTASSCEEWILEPQSDMELVRKCIEDADFSIVDESMVCEEGKYYPVIHALRGKASGKMSSHELRYGPCLLRKKDPLLLEHLSVEKRKYTKILSEITAARDDRAFERINALKQEAACVEEAMKYYEMQ